MTKNRLFLIDGHGLCYRAFYAVKSLTNSKGQPTNAVFGFCNILLKLIKDLKPTHLAVCFDVSKKTLRQDKFADYKATRQTMPDELKAQIQVIRNIVEGYRIPMIELEGYEADDVMATLAHRFASESTDVVIVTEDKDMGQMVKGSIQLYSPRLEKYIKASDVQEKFGVKPQQIADYIGLAGDVSDNIPGVKGIGEVTAQKLLLEYGSIQGIYDHIESMKASKVKEKLLISKEDAFLSKDLATVHLDVNVDVSLEDLVVKEPNREALLKLFKELEFKRWVQEFDLPVEDELNSNSPLVDSVYVDIDGHKKLIVYDVKRCLKEGILNEDALKGVELFDVFLADYVLSNGGGQYDLAKARQSQEGLKQLHNQQQAMIQEQGLSTLLHDVETPLAIVLYHVEKNGMRVDPDVLKELSEICHVKIIEIEKQLYALAGTTFNLNSPKQLSDVLFDKLKLPVIKKTKTGFSTDEEVLHRLSSQHPLPALILEYRQLAKLKSTYLDALPILINEQTGRIHTTFNQTGAETGRLSSTNPNLQNIPIRTDLGRKIREAFVPYANGHVLLSADYSQIELRVLAHLSKDIALRKAFDANQDIHRYTASLMFDVSLEAVDDKMRYAAKRVNFGIIYGISAFGLAKDLEVTQRQAQDFIDRYFLRYPNVRQFMDDEIEKAQRLGFVTTMFNRRRYLPEINSSNVGIRQFAQRQAINTPVQGTAADMIKLAMVNVNRAIENKKLSSTMVLTVHDELVFDVPQEEVDVMANLVKMEMESVIHLDVPLLVTVKTGLNWLEMKNK